MELQENLDWEEIESFLSHFNHTMNLSDGKNSIIDFLTVNFPNFDTKVLLDLNINDLKNEFLEWVAVPLKTEKPESSIQSIYFGLFISSDKELVDDLDEMKIIYLAGSSISPIVDPDDWAVEPDYLPKTRYFVPNVFKAIELELNKYKNTADVEQIIYNGLINLVIINSKQELKNLLDDESRYIGSGFDEGPVYFLGKM